MTKKKGADNVIKLTKNKTSVVLNYQEMPVISLIRGTLIGFKNSWVNRFTSARLVVRVFAADASAFSESPVPFGALVSPHHTKPSVEINQTVGYVSHHKAKQEYDQPWSIEVCLFNFEFAAGESVIIEYMDTAYINRRLDDWISRIKSFYEILTDWITDLSDLTSREGKMPDIDEEMMKTFGVKPRKINSLDIYKDRKLVMLIKPFALWTLGANGRIDLMTSSGSYIVVDVADHFMPSKWEVYLKDSRTKGVSLTKKNFLNILNA